MACQASLNLVALAPGRLPSRPGMVVNWGHPQRGQQGQEVAQAQQDDVVIVWSPPFVEHDHWCSPMSTTDGLVDCVEQPAWQSLAGLYFDGQERMVDIWLSSTAGDRDSLPAKSLGNGSLSVFPRRHHRAPATRARP